MENYYSGLNSRMMLKQAEGIFSLNCSSNNSFLKRKKKITATKSQKLGSSLSKLCVWTSVFVPIYMGRFRDVMTNNKTAQFSSVM